MNWIMDKLFLKKFTIAKWQLNLFGVTIFAAGTIFGLYVLGSKVIIPKLFAAGSPWNQTDWSGGQGASTNNQYSSVSNVDPTGTAGQFSITVTSGWSSDYAGWLYRKKITFNNTNTNIGTTAENLINFPVLIKLDKDSDITAFKKYVCERVFKNQSSWSRHQVHRF